MRAALQGARSVGVIGWKAEECEQAALESLVRKPTEDPGLAYVQGRSAAIDEFRLLTGHRNKYGFVEVMMYEEDHLHPVEELGYMDAEARIDCEKVIQLFSPRVQQVLRWRLKGLSQAEAGRKLGLTPARTCQLVTLQARRLGFRSW